MSLVIQTWYVVIDVNDVIIAMFLYEDHCDRYMSAMEEMTQLPYTKDVFQMNLKS